MYSGRKLVLAVAAAAITLSACGSGSEDVSAGTNNGGDPKLTITAPEDGANVQVPFTLKWNSPVPLGEPDTGRDHVHVYVDGKSDDYTVVGRNQFQIKDLPDGEHKVEISLQHADHSPVGPKSAITVNVAGGGSDPSTGDPGGGGGY
jgi:hypothetical protein